MSGLTQPSVRPSTENVSQVVLKSVYVCVRVKVNGRVEMVDGFGALQQVDGK